MPDMFFTNADQWLTKETLPKTPLRHWDCRDSGLDVKLTNPIVPVIYGQSGVQYENANTNLGLDIFGSAFFMLSRYEEVAISDRDVYDRFPGTASLAFREGFLNRPIVNEYLEILWACMKRLWPGLIRQARKRRTLVSCDVDIPYDCGIRSMWNVAFRTGLDLLKHHSLIKAQKTIRNYRSFRSGDYQCDAYYSAFDWMMRVNEQAGNQISFYFITDHTDSKDGCYRMDEPAIRKLIQSIRDRRHEIGLHASYNSYLDTAQTMLEANRLRRVIEQEKIKQAQIGSRQHYLRWDTPQTAVNLEASGLAYDSTLSFADRPGFRCGAW